MAEFDWVNARSNCSIALVFEDLRAGSQDDVNKMNALKNSNEFKISSGQSRFSVVNEIEVGLVRGVVRFVLTSTAIEVRDREDSLKLKATPTLNEKGECRLRVNDKEMEIWYFRKAALEGLFFPA